MFTLLKFCNCNPVTTRKWTMVLVEGEDGV